MRSAGRVSALNLMAHYFFWPGMSAGSPRQRRQQLFVNPAKAAIAHAQHMVAGFGGFDSHR
jgi:hypothetical protein